MGSTTKRASQWSVERLVKMLFLLVVLTTIGLAAFYINDRYNRPNVTLADREAQRLEEMVRRDPQNVGARVGLGDTYFNKKAYDQAIAQYEEALKQVGNHQGALLGLGLAYMQKGNTDKMVEYFDRLVQLNKDKDAAKVDRRLQTIYYQLGRVYVERGEYDLAIERLKEAVVIDRTDADSLYLLGSAMQGKGQYEDAIGAYRSAVAFVPDFVDAYRGMAQSFEKLGDTVRAGYPLGMIAFFTGDKAGALQKLEATASAVDDDAELFWALGLVREDAGKKDLAADAYSKAVALNPNHVLAKEALARVKGE